MRVTCREDMKYNEAGLNTEHFNAGAMVLIQSEKRRDGSKEDKAVGCICDGRIENEERTRWGERK